MAPALPEGSQVPAGSLLLGRGPAWSLLQPVLLCTTNAPACKPRSDLQVHLALHFKPSALLVVLQPLADGAR